MSRPRTINKAHPYTPTRGKFAGQTFYSQRQLDNAYARTKGFASAAEQQRQYRPVTSITDLGKLSARARRDYATTRNILGWMRNDPKLSLSQAVKKTNAGKTGKAERISTATVRRYAGDALSTEKHKRARIIGPDHLLREMSFVGPKGSYTVTIANSRDAQDIDAHLRAIETYLNTGDAGPLHALDDKYVTDTNGKCHKFLTDEQLITDLTDADAIDQRRYVAE